MTILWLPAALLTASAVALLLWPLLRQSAAGAASRADYDVAVFRQQLAEVERDVADGLLAEHEAEAARTEIKRRILAAAAAGEKTAAGGQPLFLAVAVAVVVPLAAFALYGRLGNPELPDMPHSQMQAKRLGVDAEQAAEIMGMVDKLAKRLEANPSDANGWATLGKSYKAVGRYTDALMALERAAALLPAPNSDVFGSMGEIIVAANDGAVVPEARAKFLQALEVTPGDPRARFYLGVARTQIGDPRGAIAVWKDLEKDTPPNAPWAKTLADHIRRTADASGLNPDNIMPQPERALSGTAAPAPAPAAPPPQAQAQPPRLAEAGEGSAEVARQRTAALAEKLAREPNDADGWAMLGRSYKALGEGVKAKEALARAVALKPKDIGFRMAYAEAILTLAPSQDPNQDNVPAEFTQEMREVLAIDPNQADALYYVGLAEQQAGRKAEAHRIWSRLLGQLKTGSPEWVELKREIDALGAGR